MNLTLTEPPILIFSMPRSGSSWLGKIFDSHPKTFYMHEPDSFIPIKKIPILTENKLFNNYEIDTNNYLNQLSTFSSIDILGKQPYFRKEYFSNSEFHIHKYKIYVNKLSKKLNLSSDFNLPNYIKHKNTRFVWKSIESLGRLNLFSKIVNNCYCIHLIRHPCGYVSSVLNGESKNLFSSNVPTSEDYNMFKILLDSEVSHDFDISYEMIKKMSPIQRLTWRWLLFNEHSLKNNLSNNNFYLVKYEDVCENPTEYTKRLFNNVNLDWSLQTEKFIHKSTNTTNNSYYSVFRNSKKISSNWRSLLSRNEIKSIEKIARQGLCSDTF